MKISLPDGTGQVEIIGTEILGTSYIGTFSEESIVRILPKSSVVHDGPYLDSDTLTIKKGQKIKWVNDDNVAHIITGGTIEDGPDGIFDSGLFGWKDI